MRRFDYLAPTRMDEAIDMLRGRPEALALAGGTDVLVQIKEGGRRVGALLSLKRIGELHTYGFENGHLLLGAAVTAGEVAADPRIHGEMGGLADGAGLIGSIQIRNMATVGGNICNASPSADTAPPLLALGAEAVIAGPGGERLAPLDQFFVGPGQTVLQPGELLKAIRIPVPPERSGSYYLRHTPRAWMDIAVVGAAAAVTLDEDGIIAAARIGLGAVAPTPIRAVEAEKALLGGRPDEALFAEAGRIAAGECSPIDDLRASADYRRHLVSVLVQRALRGATRRANSV